MRNKISLVLAGLLGSGLLVADEANTQAPREAKKALGGFLFYWNSDMGKRSHMGLLFKRSLLFQVFCL